MLSGAVSQNRKRGRILQPNKAKKSNSLQNKISSKCFYVSTKLALGKVKEDELERLSYIYEAEIQKRQAYLY